ncbi:MAG: class II aldolase/adducin family protein [Pseudomonadota bacterium]
MDQIQDRIDLATALRLATHFGLNEGICNHFSLAIDADRFLLNPHGIHWSQIQAKDIIEVNPATMDSEAEVSAFNIHHAIHQTSEHARCVLHTHMPYATALTCLTDNTLKFIHQNSLRFYNDVAYDNEYNGLADALAEGARIASCLQDKRVLFLANHGVIVIGANVAEAFDRMYYLERACEVQILAMSTGQPLRDIGANLANKTRQEFDREHSYAQAHFDALRVLV